MIKGVIFDMDGTVLDSMGNWQNNIVNYFESLGVQLTKDEQKAIKCLDWNETVDYINKQKNTGFELKAIRDGILETHYGMYKDGFKLMPGFLKFIDYLDEKGIKYYWRQSWLH